MSVHVRPAAETPARTTRPRSGRALDLVLHGFLPLLLPLVAWRWLRGRPVPGWRAKWGGENPGPPQPGAILVHGVSLGETMLIHALTPLLEERFARPVTCSTSTATGRSNLANRLPGRRHVWWPFDRRAAVHRFLTRERPAAVLLMELELWPQMLMACRDRGIPVVVVNARLSARSFRGYRRFRPWLRPILAGLTGAIAQNRLWASRLAALGVRDVRVSGSMKAGMIRPADISAIQQRRLRWRIAGHRPVLAIASTSDPEEELLLRSWLRWGREAGWQCVVAPRHPERGAAIESLCRRLDLCARRISQGDPVNDDHDVLVVDEIGHLPALYALADISIVGGSLGSGRHGQNMLEAAAAGSCICVGPDTGNFPDAMRLLRAHDAVVVIDPEDPDRALAPLAQDREARARISQAGHRAWRTDHAAIGQTLDQLSDLLRPPQPR